jgi:hypothetical protein
VPSNASKKRKKVRSQVQFFTSCNRFTFLSGGGDVLLPMANFGREESLGGSFDRANPGNLGRFGSGCVLVVAVLGVSGNGGVGVFCKAIKKVQQGVSKTTYWSIPLPILTDLGVSLFGLVVVNLSLRIVGGRAKDRSNNHNDSTHEISLPVFCR